MNKQFTLKQKIKYIKLIKKYGFDEALIHFVVEFEDSIPNIKVWGHKKKSCSPNYSRQTKIKILMKQI